MKKSALSLLLALACAFGVFASYGNTSVDSSVTEESAATAQTGESGEKIDYASQAVLDFDADSQTIEVTVKQFIDGDTTHFYADGFPEGVLKARYSAVNTPESTGQIEEWGKKASNFTRSKLENATSIVVESDSSEWKTDSTGERYMSWVWYKAPGSDTYRNLNLEILQEGLAWGSKVSESRYGELATSALAQANAMKLYVYSGEKDPDYFYGEAIEFDLKGLRLNAKDYLGKRVAFTGVVTYYVNQGVYVESYDEETQMYYGIYVYYGYNFKGASLLAPGNKVRITGKVGEFNGTYQVSDLKYNAFMPTDDDVRLLEKNHTPANVETDVATFTKTVSVVTDEGSKQVKYSELALNTSITMKNLYVKSAYTTQSGDSKGAITLTCQVDGKTVKVRTVVLRNSQQQLLTEDMLIGKTLAATGVVDCFNGEYQIKVISLAGLDVVGGLQFPVIEDTTPPEDTASSSDTTSSESESSPSSDGCGSALALSAALPLLAAVAVVVLKKREN